MAACAPERIVAVKHYRCVEDDYDTSSRLPRAAEPVLNRMAAALDGSHYCVMLADRDARIVATRWGSPRMRSVFELLGEALHGTVFREETTGTNSLATTYELRRAVAVHGDEHYIAQLHGFSCHGHPIIDPHTRGDRPLRRCHGGGVLRQLRRAG
jgi:transcriptional regulator of acetoin/glycerol metabolism